VTNILRLDAARTPRRSGPLPPQPRPEGVRFTMAAVLRRAGGDRPAPPGPVLGYTGLALADRGTAAGGPAAAAGALVVVPHELLARAALTLLRYRPGTPATCCPPVAPATLHGLRLALAETDRDLLGTAVHWCRDFLAGRRHGEQRLGSHSPVAAQLAGLVARAAALRQADLPATLASPAGRAWWIREVDELALGLIRMAGGRSVLSGQMVQLRTALLYANRIYLEGAPCPH
jgi:hypothetical protein